MKFSEKNKKGIRKIIVACLILAIFIGGKTIVIASDNGNLTGYAWMQGYGFVSMSGLGADVRYGVRATTDGLTGYAWSEKLGWISFNDAGSFYGVTYDSGNLCGYAWSEKAGYISFCDQSENEFYQVSIDGEGNFSGYAWSEKLGYINMNDSGDLYGVATTWDIPLIEASPVIFKKGIIFKRDVIIR